MILEWLGLGVTVFTQTAAENTGADDPGKKKKQTQPLRIFLSSAVYQKRDTAASQTLKVA